MGHQPEIPLNEDVPRIQISLCGKRQIMAFLRRRQRFRKRTRRKLQGTEQCAEHQPCRGNHRNHLHSNFIPPCQSFFRSCCPPRLLMRYMSNTRGQCHRVLRIKTSSGQTPTELRENPEALNGIISERTAKTQLGEFSSKLLHISAGGIAQHLTTPGSLIEQLRCVWLASFVF